MNTEWQFMVKAEGNKGSNESKRESDRCSKSNVWEGHVHIRNVVIILWEGHVHIRNVVIRLWEGHVHIRNVVIILWEGHVHIRNVVIILWESILICKRDTITKEDPNYTSGLNCITARVYDHPSDRQSELLTKVEYHEYPFPDYLESSKQFPEREMEWKYISTHY